MGVRILIVEDQQITAKDLAIRLTRLGYEIIGTAATGEEAIQLALRLQPDLVLMDVKLAGEIDGVETASLIEAKLPLPVPIIYTSAYSDTELIKRANNTTKPYAYLVKPFREPELAISISLALYQHQQQQKLQQELSNLFNELGTR